MDIKSGTVKAPTGNTDIELDGVEYDIYDLGEARSISSLMAALPS